MDQMILNDLLEEKITISKFLMSITGGLAPAAVLQIVVTNSDENHWFIPTPGDWAAAVGLIGKDLTRALNQLMHRGLVLMDVQADRPAYRVDGEGLAKAIREGMGKASRAQAAQESAELRSVEYVE